MASESLCYKRRGNDPSVITLGQLQQSCNRAATERSRFGELQHNRAATGLQHICTTVLENLPLSAPTTMSRLPQPATGSVAHSTASINAASTVARGTVSLARAFATSAWWRRMAGKPGGRTSCVSICTFVPLKQLLLYESALPGGGAGRRGYWCSTQPRTAEVTRWMKSLQFGCMLLALDRGL